MRERARRATLAAVTTVALVALVSAAGVIAGESRAGAATQAPFHGSAAAVPGTIQAEDYDTGGEGVAYHDADAVDEQGGYRPAEGVDVEATTDTGGGWNVGGIRAGEWVEYTVQVAAAGTYDLAIRFASANPGGTAHVAAGGRDVSGPITLPGTGGWQTWTTVHAPHAVTLGAGQVVLRLAFDSVAGGKRDLGNVGWFSLTGTAGGTGSTTTTSTSASTTVAPTTTTTAGGSPLPWPTSWRTAATAPTPRYEGAGVVVGGKVYVFGGYRNATWQVTRTYAVYDPAANTWKVLGNLPAGMAETHLGVATDGRTIWFMGGFAGDVRQDVDPSQVVSGGFWSYTPSTGAWKRLGSMPKARGAGTLALVGRTLHYVGGNLADRVTNSADHFTYDLDTGAWGTKKPIPDGKDHLSSVVLGGKIYVLGGEHGHDELQDQQRDAHVYDPATDSWRSIANLPIAKSHDEWGTFVLDGRIVMAGGQIVKQDATANVVAYDPSTNRWTTLPSLPAPRQGAVVQPVGNVVVITGGAVRPAQPKATTWKGTLPT
jgi:N-acetylneuraminic acid mutarotase